MAKKPCNVALGRFQPFTKGHLQMLKDGYDKNGYPAVVFMIANKKFDAKHPFSDELIAKEMEEVKKNYDFVAETVPATSADIVKIGQKLDEMGYEAHLWLCGDDREAQFKRQAENPKYREMGKFPDDFTTYTGTGRTEGVSGTAVRDALKADDKKKFIELTPKGADKYFDEMKQAISQVKESLKDLATYVEIFEARNKRAKGTVGDIYKWYTGEEEITDDGITMMLDNGMFDYFDDDVKALSKFLSDNWDVKTTIVSTETNNDWEIEFSVGKDNYIIAAMSFYGDKFSE